MLAAGIDGLLLFWPPATS